MGKARIEDTVQVLAMAEDIVELVGNVPRDMGLVLDMAPAQDMGVDLNRDQLVTDV